MRVDTPEAQELMAAELRPLGLKFDVAGMNASAFVMQKLIDQGRITLLSCATGECGGAG